MATDISVFCIWRDSESHIHQTLRQLENLETLKDYSFSFYFYENDSKDNTVEILNKWLENRKGSLLSENLNAPKFGRTTSPQRMKFLCSCRNKCKELAHKNESDYSLLIDSDIEFSNENFLLQADFLKSNRAAVMATANVRQNIPDLVFGVTPDSYYDVYPFRDKHGNAGIYFADCPSYKQEDQFNWKIGMPIKCCSAFGGFALLTSEAFNKVSWSADIHCDHVNMCFDLLEFGSIFCLPRSKVYVTIDSKDIDLHSFAQSGRQQFLHYSNINE